MLRDVEAIRRKQDRKRQKKLAKRRNQNEETRTRYNKMDELHESRTSNPACVQSPESSFVESTVSVDTSSTSRLEESIDSLLIVFFNPQLEEEGVLRSNAQTFQQVPAFIHIDCATNVGGYAPEGGGSNAETGSSSLFSLLDTSPPFLDWDVHTVSSSSCSVTSNDWFCSTMPQI